MKVTFKLSEREFYWLVAVIVWALLRVLKWLLE
jgi:hypothetical protein